MYIQMKRKRKEHLLPFKSSDLSLDLHEVSQYNLVFSGWVLLIVLVVVVLLLFCFSLQFRYTLNFLSQSTSIGSLNWIVVAFRF